MQNSGRGGESTTVTGAMAANLRDSDYKSYGTKYTSYKNVLGSLNAQGKIPASENSDLTWVVAHESGFSTSAQNPHSTAFGYGQFLNSTQKSMTSKYKIPYDTPEHQLQLTYLYIKERYGTAAKAKAFWLSHNPHWY